MKKLLLTLALALVGILAQASDLDVKTGTARPLQDGGDIYVTFDFKGAKWDQTEALTRHYPNLSYMIKRVPAEFGRKFKKECENSSITTNRKRARWIVNIKVNNMDNAWKPNVFGPGGWVTKISGSITVIDNRTGERICTIKIDEVDGGRNKTEEESFYDAFEELGEEFAKLMNKGR